MGVKFLEQKPIIKEGYKICSKCKRELPADENHFYIGNKASGKFVAACKECYGYSFNKPKPVVKQGYKICSNCGLEKPLSKKYFGKRLSGSVDGFNGVCRTCERIRINNWINNNRERYRAKQREWKCADPNRKEKWDAYYNQNRDVIIARSKKWDKEHKERSLVRSHEWYENNRARAKANTIAWRKANPEKVKLSRQKRRTLKKKVKATLTNEQWETTLKHFGGKCAYCGRYPKHGEVLQHDHFYPLAKNGELSVFNTIPACGECNSSKGKKLFSSWYPKYKYYSKKREKDVLEYLNYHNGIQQLAFI